MLLGTQNITTGDTRRYEVDYTQFLQFGEVLTSGFTVFSGSQTSFAFGAFLDVSETKLYFFIAAGKNPEIFPVTVTATTSYGQVINDTITFTVEPLTLVTSSLIVVNDPIFIGPMGSTGPAGQTGGLGPQGPTGAPGTAVQTGATGPGIVGTTFNIEVTFGGASGNTFMIGSFVDVPVDMNFTIKGVEVFGGPTGWAQFDIYQTPQTSYDYANTHPVAGDSITANAKPVLNNTYRYIDTGLSGWIVGITAGTLLRFITPTGTTGISNAAVALKCVRL